MENEAHPKHPKPSLPLRNGHLVLHSPCSVGSDAFSPAEAGNKFCSQCNKVVHNLIGKSDAEIKALFAANGGNLCGTMIVRVPVVQRSIRYIPSLQKPTYFKHLAATASLLLLAHWSQASAPKSKAPVEWQSAADGRPLSKVAKAPSQNTMVTGVILDQDSSDRNVDLEISIYSKQVLVAKTTAINGLFKIDLEGKVKPDDIIGLVIGANTARYSDDGERLKNRSAKRTLKLRDAQNIALVVYFEIMYSEQIINGGIGWDEPVMEPIPIEIIDVIEPVVEEPLIIGPVMPKWDDF